MKICRKLLWIFLLAVAVGGNSYAQEQMPAQDRYVRTDGKKSGVAAMLYSRGEQWYVQVQGGGNYMAAENTRFVNFYRATALSYAISAGKNFSTLWGIRLQLTGGGDKGVYFPYQGDSPRYSFQHVGGIAEVTFNVTNFIRNAERGDESTWNVMLMLGPGVVHTYHFRRNGIDDYPLLDTSPRSHFLIYGGIEVSRQVDKNWNVNLEVSTDWMRDAYNGVVYDRPVEGHVNLLLGVRYTFGK